MADSSFAKKVDKQEPEQLRSSSAQRLIEKLLIIKHRREESRKRWFWELMQNASDYNDTVNLDLVVTDTQVIFSHDGLPFQMSDIFNLIRPDSNKKEDSRRKDSIGKFGSGFVSTHILSSHVSVEGIVVDDDDESKYKFKIDIERKNFNNKQILLTDIQKTLNQLKSAKPIKDGKKCKTSFTYYLNEPLPGINPLGCQEVDLKYLYEVLPYTLCFMPKIKSVKIHDNRLNKKDDYTIKRSEKSEGNTIIFNIDKGFRTLEEYKMVTFQNGKSSSVIRIKNNKVSPIPKSMSRLFCGLPLVGTERIGLPIIVNSLDFEPTIEREGVEIDPSCDKLNISILESAVDLYDFILEYIEEESILNAFEIANISKEYNGTYESKEKFKDHFVDAFKDRLLARCVAENANGDFICVDELRIPYKDGKANKELYGFALKFLPESLPKDYLGWAKSLRICEDLVYTYEDLADDVSSKSRLELLDKQKRNAESWLKECISFLIKCDKNICSGYYLLPNQLGTFKYLTELYIDKKLPAQLKRINERTENRKKPSLSSILLNQNFNKLVDTQEFTLCMLAQRIDDNIKDLYAENDSTVPEKYKEAVSSLYSWIKDSHLDEDELKKIFPWFFPKQASIIADMMTDEERMQSLKIVRSGKMESLASLAESSLTDEQIRFIASHPAYISTFMSNAITDDCSFADPDEGELGERIVWEELNRVYGKQKGYKIIWASHDYNEARFDFEVLKNGKTQFYCDAKSTMRGLNNSDSIPLFIRKSQWNFLSELSDKIPYFVARLFLADNNEVKFLRLTLKH